MFLFCFSTEEEAHIVNELACRQQTNILDFLSETLFCDLTKNGQPNLARVKRNLAAQFQYMISGCAEECLYLLNRKLLLFSLEMDLKNEEMYCLEKLPFLSESAENAVKRMIAHTIALFSVTKENPPVKFQSPKIYLIYSYFSTKKYYLLTSGIAMSLLN